MPCAGDHGPAAHHVSLCGVTGGDVSECTSYQALIRGRLSRHRGGYSHIISSKFRGLCSGHSSLGFSP